MTDRCATYTARVTDPKPTGRSVSLSKDGGETKKVPRPTSVTVALGALAVTAVFGIVAALSFGKPQKAWDLAQQVKSNAKLKKSKQLSHDKLVSQVDKLPGTLLLISIVFAVLIALVGFMIWKQRWWSRWALLAIWVVGTLQGTPGGISGLLGVSQGIPGAYKYLAALASAAMLVAVVLCLWPGSREYFLANKPAAPAGAPQRRGLFAPRPPRTAQPARTAPVNTRTATTDAHTVERARAKKRASADSVAKGADLARTRAKAASKSRRTER
jgi:hypothetical protein